MLDIFISYTSADEDWAEWIGYTLEEAGFDVLIQKWDFRPGSNFILEMQKAAATTERTIIVLSPDYLKSAFAASEWAAAFARDPQGDQRRLVPVLVKECQIPGLLKPLVHINIVGLEEIDARERLISGVRTQRAKPSNRPKFPGNDRARTHAVYPGSNSSDARGSSSVGYMPKIKRPASDLDKRRFLKQAFSTIKKHFRDAVIELGERHREIEIEFEGETKPEFRVEMFIDGRSKCACKIWMGDDFGGNAICYAEGRQIRGNACNEILSLTNNDDELSLRATLDIGIRFKNSSVPLDTKQMTPEQAADYLWRRLVVPLET